MDICLLDYDITTAAGRDKTALATALLNYQSGLRKNDFPGCEVDTWIGRVDGIDATGLGEWESRNNALAKLGLTQGTVMKTVASLKERFGPSRLGVVIGSSTSSIDRTETAYKHLTEDAQLALGFQQPNVHNPGAPALFVAHLTAITGPAMTVNVACSSSAKVFATADRWLRGGIVDAVLVGGVDTLCLSVLYGFDSLQLVSSKPCKPFDEARDGINLGEAAGFALLVRTSDFDTHTGVVLAGYGESSDAYHMSHPHPEGQGAKLAMQQALQRADLNANDIDYINLHGTSSRANDDIEGKLVEQMFPSLPACSSTKGWTGHTLGAAGITEALIAVQALQSGVAPGTLNLTQMDGGFNIPMTAENRAVEMQHVMSNSFGFGGNNCCLIFSQVART